LSNSKIIFAHELFFKIKIKRQIKQTRKASQQREVLRQTLKIQIGFFQLLRINVHFQYTIPLSAVSFVASKVFDKIFTANFFASSKVICPSLYSVFNDAMAAYNNI